jgi:hypothetical protein
MPRGIPASRVKLSTPGYHFFDGKRLIRRPERMTIHQMVKTLTIFLPLHPRKFSMTEKVFLKRIEDGLSGMGDVPDEDVTDYISPKQVRWIEMMALRFKVTKFTPFK